MQTIQGDASDNVHSLDYFYSEIWFENEMEATVDYKPKQEYPMSPYELWAEKGDVIVNPFRAKRNFKMLEGQYFINVIQTRCIVEAGSCEFLSIY
uniref:Uncharacterized protein n=1 Tax=Meloidogyne incognita TaxID=6306 RepID=A0A914LZ41_MELIC